SVDFSRRPFTLVSGGGETILARCVIVATGAAAKYPDLPSVERFKNRGVSACAVCDGGLPRFRNRPIVVVGGGDSAVEEADYLTRFASKVYLVHRRDQLRASSVMAKRALEHPKIEILWNRVVAEILGTDADGVTGVRLESTVAEPERIVEASGFFAAIGHTPNTMFLKDQLELTANGYIVLPESHRQRTSVPGVFAAGDVADPFYRQAITSAASGAAAALEAERFLKE
ncbi:MAG: FAD-dependent oxidoreductase, partial [Planctomycetia bacterium]|nr:FAD-dependent oxidoreductase [Planctomycetia bacterium]